MKHREFWSRTVQCPSCRGEFQQTSYDGKAILPAKREPCPTCRSQAAESERARLDFCDGGRSAACHAG
jgi:hypothetical protein